MKKNKYEKYENIPKNKKERMTFIFEKLKITEKDIIKIKEKKNEIEKNKKKNKRKIEMVFYIVPEPIGRPRKGKYSFYVPNIDKFYKCMNEYLKYNKELSKIFIISECKIDLQYYLPIPSDMKKYEKILAEMKVIRHIKRPDWDNLGKGSDMLSKIWIDDSIVIDARVRKYYSFKPRIEVTIFYYNENCIEYYEKYLNKMLKRVNK